MRKLKTILFLLLAAVAPATAQEYYYIDGDEPLTLPEKDSVVTDDKAFSDSLVVDPSLHWPHNAVAKLQHLLGSDAFSKSYAGVMVYDLTADSIIFRHNERQLMRPASTMKLVTAITALDVLGGAHLFSTEMRMTGHVDSLTLRGNLYLRGGMDPLTGNDDVRALVECLQQQRIDTIRGNIYADLTMKDSDLLGSGWCWDDDNPILSPLLVGGKNQFIRRFCQELRAAGIVLTGDTLTGAVPKMSRELCTRSHTIDQVLQRMMKKSDNLFAESMFYHIAQQSDTQGPATAKGARQMVNRLIQKLRLQPDDYHVADGSGLSLYNYVTAELLVRLLIYAFDNDNIFTHLLPSLPVAGVDGTIATRMNKGHAKGNVKAKTGTVTGVSSLAGYCTAANGHYLCFAIINNGIRKAQTGRTFQDRVCEALCAP